MERLIDKYLPADYHDTFVLMCIRDRIGNDLIDITTVVQYHNALGKAYFFFIKPFHKMIVPRVAKELI